MSAEVHIIAVAARTPLGLTAEASAAAVRAGIDRISEHPFVIDRVAEPLRSAQDPGLDPALSGPERFLAMARTALEELVEKIMPLHLDFSRTSLRVALPEERPGWTHQDADAVYRGLGRLALPMDFEPIQLFSNGHAAGLMALEQACARIWEEQEELSVIVGVDSFFQFETLEWLDKNRQLATSYHRGAFFPGEGAGAFAVASSRVVDSYGIPSLAVVRGIGAATEKQAIKTDGVCLGEGLTKSVRKAVATLHLPDEAVDGIIGDINGERYRSEEWGFTLLRLPDALRDPTGYELPSACWGDMGAASGPLFVMLATAAAQRGSAKGPRYLIWNSSEGGRRAAAVLELKSQKHGLRL